MYMQPTFHKYLNKRHDNKIYDFHVVVSDLLKFKDNKTHLKTN